MARLVMKFGGAALIESRNVGAVLSLVQRARQRGDEVVVVISAMARATDSLVQRLLSFSPGCEGTREYDVVISSGEQVAAGTLAALLLDRGVRASSCMGWQLPIVTDTSHGRACIQHVRTEKIEAMLGNGVVPVVAGFQGITDHGDITTLGRGGSDLTAVALASHLRADTCYFYKDVDGIYTADPKIIRGVRRFDVIDYQTLLNMARLGAGVVAPQSVEWGWQHRVPLIVSSFLQETSPGTKVVDVPEQSENECRPLVRRPPSPAVVLMPDLASAVGRLVSIYVINGPRALSCIGLPKPTNVVLHPKDVAEWRVEREHAFEVGQSLHSALWGDDLCSAQTAGLLGVS